MTQTINYQPWLQAVQNIAKHYRIEASEERIRLQLDSAWQFRRIDQCDGQTDWLERAQK